MLVCLGLVYRFKTEGLLCLVEQLREDDVDLALEPVQEFNAALLRDIVD